MSLFNLSENMASRLIRSDFTRVLWANSGAAAFLAPRAAAYVNGQTVVVDGGSTA